MSASCIKYGRVDICTGQEKCLEVSWLYEPTWSGTAQKL